MVFILLFIALYFLFNSGLKKVKGSNNKFYYTQQNDNAVEILVNLDKFITKLKKHLLDDYPSHKLIQKKLKKSILIYEIPKKNTKSVAYTLNKNILYVCLRNKNKTLIKDYNKIYFVVMHELAHLITKTYGHNQEYWDNNKLIIKTAIKYKLYKYKNYYSSPVNYCGININSSPYILGGYLEDNSNEIMLFIGVIIFIIGMILLFKYFKKNSESDNISPDDAVVFDPNYKVSYDNEDSGTKNYNIWGERVIRRKGVNIDPYANNKYESFEPSFFNFKKYNPVQVVKSPDGSEFYYENSYKNKLPICKI